MNAGSNSEIVGDFFDPLSPAFAQNPYPVYSKLRGLGALKYFPVYEMWLVPRYSDIAAIVMDLKMVRSLEGLLSEKEIADRKKKDNWHDMPYHSRFIQINMLDSDGPVHDRLRKQVFKSFTPALIARLRPSIQQFVDNLIDTISDLRKIDYVEDFAAAVPGHVIGMLVGIPDEDCPQLRTWSDNIVQYFDIDRSDERKKLAEDTTYEFYRYLKDLKAERRASPGEDLISRLIEVEEAGFINEDEFISTCMLIVMAGHGSTLDVLGSGMHALLRFPDEMMRLRQNPSLINTAVQEMFRFESPLPFFHRYATEDTVVNGQDFPKGTRFGLLYGSANRDESFFEHADSFDISRKPNRHQAFGGGAHFCLGNHLARLNMDIIFTSLLRRFSSIELAEDEPEYKRGLGIRGPKALQIELTVA